MQKLSTVAIVGGGLAGLSTATRLAELGIAPTVFDKGRVPGGRACSRVVADPQVAFDHGCQFLAPQNDEFKAAVQGWAAAGAVAEWRGRLGEIEAGSAVFRARGDCSESASFCCITNCPGPVYAGVPSMGAVAQLLAQQVEQAGGSIVTGQAVTGLEWSSHHGAWTLHGGPRASSAASPPAAAAQASLGTFGAVVLADALTAVTHSPGYAGLLEDRGPELQGMAQRMLSASSLPAFSLLVAFAEPLGEAVPFDGASVHAVLPAGSCSALSWVARNSSKPGAVGAVGADSSKGECWVAVSTPEHGAEVLRRWPLLKGGAYNPQTAAYKSGVAAQLLEEFQALLQPFLSAAGGGALPEVTYLNAQRWGRAFVGAPLPEEFLAEPERRVAACGDFCFGGTGSGTGTAAAGAERAWRSGRRAADAVARWVKAGGV